MAKKRVLELLAKKYPNIHAATAEIINLNAILSLPKGTEYFLSDLHGEYDAFAHMIKSASGGIRIKIDETLGADLTKEGRYNLAALIYNPEHEIEKVKKALSEKELESWYYQNIYNLIEICRAVSTKYSRSKARKRLPKYWGYSIDELLHADSETNRSHYYTQIIKSIIEMKVADTYVKDLAEVISSLAVDKLHIIGDIYDRGPHPDYIMDFLMEHHDVDIQWGNHDILWMGAAAGNWACITNLLRINISYNNIDMIEVGYGINLRPLAVFAEEVYKNDPCTNFKPKGIDENIYGGISEELSAKMHKAIAICQFKVEGEIIKNHPEFELESRLSLNHIDFEKNTIMIKGEEYELKDSNLPTIDPKNPYKLTEGEENLLKSLAISITSSEKLRAHMDFMFTNGAIYLKSNGNLLYHGCIPMTEEGEFDYWEIDGVKYAGKALMDHIDKVTRNAYYHADRFENRGSTSDIIWYLWLGPKSPFFGKDQMTTFERLFIADKKTHKENTAPYYKYIDNKETCQMILKEFGLKTDGSNVILNGHVPVKIKDGESPVRAGGLRYIIDGGISKAYHKTTGIAGYTLIYNSFSLSLVEHMPYIGKNNEGDYEYHRPKITTIQSRNKQLTIADVDKGVELKQEVDELLELIESYKAGKIGEVL